MNEQLKNRLIGALVLLAVALLMAFLLPKPGQVERDDGVRRVTIDLDGGEPKPVAEGDRTMPPAIAAPEPAALSGEPDPVVEGEPEIDEPAPADAEGDSRMAAAPVAIRPSETLAQSSTSRVLPAPVGKAPPVQLKQDNSMEGLTAPGATTPPPPAKPEVPPPARPEIAARPRLEPPAPRAQAEVTKPVAPAKPEPAAAPPPPKPEVAVAKPAPAPAAKAEPARPEPAKPAGKERWSVQVGSYAALENARTAEGKLKAAGLPTQFGPVDTAKGVLYRVRVGPLSDEAAAQAAKAKAVQLGFAQATVRKD